LYFGRAAKPFDRPIHGFNPYFWYMGKSSSTAEKQVALTNPFIHRRGS